MRNTGQGWVTAEYGMLPRATHTRGRREAAAGKQSGRTQEIQRLIGRSLRAVVDLKALGERQVADRLRRHPGRWRHPHRLHHRRLGRDGDGLGYLRTEGVLKADPSGSGRGHLLRIFEALPVRDLDYEEDSNAEADGNFVLTGSGTIVEIQATGEKRGFSRAEFDRLFQLAEAGCNDLFKLQKSAVDEALARQR